MTGPEIRDAVARFMLVAACGGNVGHHLRAIVTAALTWAEAERVERVATEVASVALTGPRAKWDAAKLELDQAQRNEQILHDALLVVARDVAALAAKERA